MAVLSSCAGGTRSTPVTTPATLSTENGGVGAEDGAAILERSCTACHGLRGLSAYADYWGEAEWRSMVETMIGYGAKVEPDEVPVLVRYLAVRYGTAGAGDQD